MAPLTPEESAALAAALQDDPAAAPRLAKPLKIPGQSQVGHFDVTRNAQPYGAETYSFKRALPSLNAKVGADLGTGPAPTPTTNPTGRSRPTARNTGAAWASLDVIQRRQHRRTRRPDRRPGPARHDAEAFAAARRQLFGNLAEQYRRDQQHSGAPAASATPGLPMMTLPQATNTGATQTWDDQPSVKFDVLPTGTAALRGSRAHEHRPGAAQQPPRRSEIVRAAARRAPRSTMSARRRKTRALPPVLN